MNQLPLILKFQETVLGNGFAAGLVFDARVLMEEEETSVWIYGVNPGAIAASGADLASALADFRRRVRMYLVDVATDYPNFSEFKGEIERFFYQEAGAAEWTAARDAVRAGAQPEGSRGLIRETAVREPSVRVECLQMKASCNLPPENEALPAMAA